MSLRRSDTIDKYTGEVIKFMFRFLEIFYIPCPGISISDSSAYVLDLHSSTRLLTQLCVLQIGRFSFKFPNSVMSILLLNPSPKAFTFWVLDFSVLLVPHSFPEVIHHFLIM